jgi:hypothetical protein
MTRQAAGQEHAMNLSYRQENQIRRIEGGLRGSDPHLGTMFGMFGQLHAGNGMSRCHRRPPATTASEFTVAALTFTAAALSFVLTKVAMAATTGQHARGQGAGSQANTSAGPGKPAPNRMPTEIKNRGEPNSRMGTMHRNRPDLLEVQ